MIRHGNLFAQCFTSDNLYAAFLDARKGKRNKRSCFQFERNLGANLAILHQQIHDGSYRPRPYHHFMVYEPKPRLIHAPAFRDVVAQHALYRVVYPLFDRTFIDQSFACRKGKGTHVCADYTQKALRQYDGDLYTLKLDIRRYFYSIDRDILRGLIERKIKDSRLINMMMEYAKHGDPLGVPIGNLLSQLFATIYLSPVDHFIKRELKIQHYARYVDDMVLVGLTREACLEAKRKIEEFLAERLHLSLSRATIQKIKKGVNFVGYRTWQGRRFIRKHSLYRYRRAVRKGNLDSIVSHLGHAVKTQSYPYMIQQLGERYDLYRLLPENHRRRHDLPHRAAA